MSRQAEHDRRTRRYQTIYTVSVLVRDEYFGDWQTVEPAFKSSSRLATALEEFFDERGDSLLPGRYRIESGSLRFEQDLVGQRAVRR